MRVSVIVPAYNASATIAATLDSVLAQSHRQLQLLVVDDGSTDDTAAIAARYSDRRLTLIRQPNAGVAAARNRGLAAAEGAAVLFLDADDVLAAPSAIATLAACMAANSEAIAAIAPYARLGPGDRSPCPVRYRTSAKSRHLLRRLLVQNQFANGGHLLIRTAAARRAGGFLPGLAYGEDWEFFIRLALLGRFAFVPASQPLLLVRSRADGAYRRCAADPAAFKPCMDAIFGNPDLLAQFGPRRLGTMRRRTEAENAWIIGRELVRQGRISDGRHWLLCSVSAAPSPRRLALLGMAHALSWIPPRWRGPFRSYA